MRRPVRRDGALAAHAHAISVARLFRREAHQLRVLKKRFERNTRASARDAVAMGKLLVRVKDRIPHGFWLPWVRKNFGSVDRAEHFMRVVKFGNLPNSSMALSVLLELARRDVPTSVAHSIIERAQAGEQFTAKQVRLLVQTERQTVIAPYYKPSEPVPPTTVRPVYLRNYKTEEEEPTTELQAFFGLVDTLVAFGDLDRLPPAAEGAAALRSQRKGITALQLRDAVKRAAKYLEGIVEHLNDARRLALPHIVATDDAAEGATTPVVLDDDETDEKRQRQVPCGQNIDPIGRFHGFWGGCIWPPIGCPLARLSVLAASEPEPPSAPVSRRWRFR